MATSHHAPGVSDGAAHDGNGLAWRRVVPETWGMPASPLFQKVDAVTIPVPDLDAGLRFYRDALGHPLRWHNDDIGQAGLALAGSDTEIVLTTRQGYEPDWLVASADEAAAAVRAADTEGNVTAVACQP
jgi:hypothetical protein